MTVTPVAINILRIATWYLNNHTRSIVNSERWIAHAGERFRTRTMFNIDERTLQILNCPFPTRTVNPFQQLLISAWKNPLKKTPATFVRNSPFAVFRAAVKIRAAKQPHEMHPDWSFPPKNPNRLVSECKKPTNKMMGFVDSNVFFTNIFFRISEENR
jgi:hypothetical protein